MSVDCQTVAYASSDLLLLAESADSVQPQPLVVAFSASVATNVANAPRYSARTLRAIGVHQLHVMACRRHGWQTTEMSAALAAARAYAAAVGASEVLTLGVSVGGFAALLFAPELGASRVLAFSPQCTVDLRKLRFDPRWQWPLYGEDARNLQATRGPDGRLPHDDMEASLAAPIDRYIIFDREIPDADHARRMRGPRTALFGLSHASHAVPRFLKETGCYTDLLAAFASNDVRALRHSLGRAWRHRWDSDLYRHNLLADRSYACRHPERHLNVLLAQVPRHPRSLPLRRALIVQHLLVGDSVAALQVAMAAASELPDAPPAARLFEQAVRAVVAAENGD